MKTLEGKKIWITGASSGIGKALSIELSKYVVELIISSRNIAELNEVKLLCEKNGSKCHVLPVDLSEESQVRNVAEKVLEEFGYIDILVNNGGISQRAYAYETDFEVDRKIMEINYFSGVLLTKLLLPTMLARNTGHIVAISSISGKFGFFLRSAYSASKFAMSGFYESLYLELKEKGINITIVFPGRVNTNVSFNALLKDGQTNKKSDKELEEGISPQKCAKDIIRAIKKDKKEVLVGGKELIMVYINRLFPRIFNFLITKIKH